MKTYQVTIERITTYYTQVLIKTTHESAAMILAGHEAQLQIDGDPSILPPMDWDLDDDKAEVHEIYEVD